MDRQSDLVERAHMSQQECKVQRLTVMLGIAERFGNSHTLMNLYLTAITVCCSIIRENKSLERATKQCLIHASDLVIPSADLIYKL